MLINYDFSQGWKPYEGGKLPSTSDIPKSIQRTMTSTVVDGKDVHLAGSLETAQYLEEHGAIPLGWRIYEGGELKHEIPKKILDLLQVKEYDGKQVLLVAPEAFYYVEMCNFTPLKHQ